MKSENQLLVNIYNLLILTFMLNVFIAFNVITGDFFISLMLQVLFTIIVLIIGNDNKKEIK